MRYLFQSALALSKTTTIRGEIKKTPEVALRGLLPPILIKANVVAHSDVPLVNIGYLKRFINHLGRGDLSYA